MADEDIYAAVGQYPAEWVILTGGEPSLHIDAAFVKDLKETTGKLVAIETNGTMPLPDVIDWVTVSPKISECRVSRADEIKVVETGQDLEPYFTLPCRIATTRMFLQPCFVEDKEERESNLRRTVSRVLADPRWNLSVQMHRFIGIP